MDRERGLSLAEAEAFLAYLRAQSEYHWGESRALVAENRYPQARDYKYEGKIWGQAAAEFERLLKTGKVPSPLVSRRKE